MMDAKIQNGAIGGGIFDLLAGSQVMGPSVGALIQPTGGESGAAFGNLLDLVSDMQLADEQGPVQSDFLAQQSTKLNDPALTALVAGASQGAWADPLAKSQLLMPQAPAKAAVESKLGVGRQALPNLKAGETPSASELLLGAEVTARAGLQAQAQAQASKPMDAESARIWAAALATGDIKAVALEAQEEAPAEKPIPMAAMLGLEKAPAAVAATPIATATSKVAPVAALKGAETVKPTETLSASATQKPVAPAHKEAQLQAQVQAPTHASASETVKAKATPAAAAAPVAVTPTLEAKAQAQSQSKPQDESKASESAGFKPFVAETRLKLDDDKQAPKKAVNGSDFLLERAAAAPTKAEAPSLVAGDKIGQQGDGRVSSQSLDFVADKIDSLRQQGGGKLRVELNPGHLGSVEIRVSNVRGLMKVEVLAEKPETVKALASSKAELAGKLEAIAPTKLDVGALLAPASHVNAVATTTTTGELLNMRTAQAQAQNNQVSNLNNLNHVAGDSMAGSGGFGSNSDRSSGGSSFERSSDWMSQRDQSQQQGQQREERRDRARREWEDFSQERKSA